MKSKYSDKEAKIYISKFANNQPSGVIEGFSRNSDEIIIDCLNSYVMDHSSIEAINALTERYRKLGKVLHLKHLSKDCRLLLNNADEIVDINVIEDPQYHVATDKL